MNNAVDGEVASEKLAAERFVRFVDERAGYADHLPVFASPPPSPDAAHRKRGRCEGLGRSHRSKLPHINRDLARFSCRGVECLLRQRCTREAPATRTRLFLAASGACSPQHADEWGLCPPGVPLTRQPTPLLADETDGTVRALQLPQGCSPLRVRSAFGLGVLLCEQANESADVYAIDRRGAWRHETTLQGGRDADTLVAARDGTLLLQQPHAHDGTVPAWVRTPLPLGADGAWRSVAREHARAYSVAEGGNVVVVVVPSEAIPPDPPATPTFILDTPSNAQILAEEISLPGALWHVQLGEDNELQTFWSEAEGMPVVGRALIGGVLAPMRVNASSIVLPNCGPSAPRFQYPYCWSPTCPPRAWRDVRGEFVSSPSSGAP